VNELLQKLLIQRRAVRIDANQNFENRVAADIFEEVDDFLIKIALLLKP